MCRSKKQKSYDTPLVEKHTLLSRVYTAEFYSGNETAVVPVKTITRVFASSINGDRGGAIPRDVSSNTLKAFAPTKTKVLQEEKEWKCICCNQGASSYCSSVVGAPSMETVICFTEKCYVVCSNEECIVKVTRKKNEDCKKLAASDFDFRFSFRSALRPIGIVDDGMSESLLGMSVEKEEEANAETKSVVMEEKENPLIAMEKEIMSKVIGRESYPHTDISASAMNAVSFNETKKRKRDPMQEELLPENTNQDNVYKRIKMNGGDSNVDGAYVNVSKSIQCQPTNDTTQEEGVKENVGSNAAAGRNIEPKRFYLKEFPFIFLQNAWHCRYCLGLPHSGSHHYYPSHIGKPPSNYFIDQHLRLCPVMIRHCSSIN